MSWINPGMSTPTGQPSTQPGFLHCRHRLASSMRHLRGVAQGHFVKVSAPGPRGSCSGIGCRGYFFAFALFLPLFPPSIYRRIRTFNPTRICHINAYPVQHAVLFVALFFLLTVGLQARINSSKSTWWPSNSGPSTQANLVSPPTVTRHPPHMPVPSTMIGLRLTMVFTLYSLVNLGDELHHRHRADGHRQLLVVFFQHLLQHLGDKPVVP